MNRESLGLLGCGDLEVEGINRVMFSGGLWY